MIDDTTQPATREWFKSIGAFGAMAVAAESLLVAGKWNAGQFPVSHTQRRSGDSWSHYAKELPAVPTRGQVRLWLEEDEV